MVQKALATESNVPKIPSQGETKSNPPLLLTMSNTVVIQLKVTLKSRRALSGILTELRAT